MMKLMNFSRNLYEPIIKNYNNFRVIFSVRNAYLCTDNIQIEGLNKDINISDLIKNDPETEKKLRVLVLETDVMRQEGSMVPDISFLKQQHWQELLLKSSRSQRRKYLEFLFKIERKKENFKERKDQARIERESRPEFVSDGHLRYGLNHNTFFIRIYDTTINHMYNNRLITACKFGQPLVIDCGYDDNMNNRESNNCAKQIMLAFAENRFNQDPFDLHLCNADASKPTLKALRGHIATLHEPWFPLHVNPESYLDTKYPSIANGAQPMSKDAFVYLTPHCREEMTRFDHDAVYIIGGIVDKVNQEPLSLARAKAQGLRMQKLPLDRYLSWGDGSGKSLTINQMVLILLDVKNTGDWEYALRHVPRRKVLGSSSQGAAASLGRRIERQGPSFDRRSTKDLIKDLMKN